MSVQVEMCVTSSTDPAETQNAVTSSTVTLVTTSDNINTKSTLWKAVLTTIIACIGSVCIGSTVAYPSVAMPNLNQNPGSVFRVSANELSWIGSLPFLTGFPCALISGWMMNQFGRKLSLMLASVPFLIGWVIIASAYNVTMLYIGRLLSGCLFLIFPTIGVYISEIAPPQIRSMLMSFHEISLNVGLLLTYIVGMYIPWNWLAIEGAALLAMFTCMMAFMPETPRWLMMKGRREEAIKTLEWLRGEDKDITLELSEIETSIRETSELVPWLNYLRRPMLKCFLISQMAIIFREMSGINVVRFYTVFIFQSVGITNIDPNVQTVIVGVVLLVGSSLFTATAEVLELRTFMLLSSVIMALSLGAVGAFFKVKEYELEFAISYMYWLPLLGLIGTSIGYVFGIGPMPFVLTSELFSTRARARASSMGVANVCVFGFLITKLFHNISEWLGTSGAFWVYASFCAIEFVVVFFMVPVTRGKTLEEIEVDLNTST